MILTLDAGKITIYTSTGSIPVEVNHLDDIHNVIEKYSIDFVSKEVLEAELWTTDKNLISIIEQFKFQRACVLSAAYMFKELPKS
jgi:hypothetical protein